VIRLREIASRDKRRLPAQLSWEFRYSHELTSTIVLPLGIQEAAAACLQLAAQRQQAETHSSIPPICSQLHAQASQISIHSARTCMSHRDAARTKFAVVRLISAQLISSRKCCGSAGVPPFPQAAGHRSLKAHSIAVEAIRDALAGLIVGGRTGRHFAVNISHWNLSMTNSFTR
jgi:hypothetical protein